MNFLSILAAFDEKEVNQMRKHFKNMLDSKIAEEKVYCRMNKTEPQMNKQKSTVIINLLEKCTNGYQVTALERMVLTDFLIPTWEEVEERAHMLSDDALKT